MKRLCVQAILCVMVLRVFACTKGWKYETTKNNIIRTSARGIPACIDGDGIKAGDPVNLTPCTYPFRTTCALSGRLCGALKRTYQSCAGVHSYSDCTRRVLLFPPYCVHVRKCVVQSLWQPSVYHAHGVYVPRDCCCNRR